MRTPGENGTRNSGEPDLAEHRRRRSESQRQDRVAHHSSCDHDHGLFLNGANLNSRDSYPKGTPLCRFAPFRLELIVRTMCSSPLAHAHYLQPAPSPADLDSIQDARGECGDSAEERQLYANIAQFILAKEARDGPYLLNAISIQGWQANTARKMKAKVAGPDGKPEEVSGALWADEAESLSAQGRAALPLACPSGRSSRHSASDGCLAG